MSTHLFRLSANGGEIGSSEGLPNNGGAIRLQGNTNNRQFITFYSSSGNLSGSITILDANVNYNRTSDYRIKSDVNSIINVTFIMRNLNPVSYHIEGGKNKHEGYLAHEVQAFVPNAVSGE
jgi:hypothetical protein